MRMDGLPNKFYFFKMRVGKKLMFLKNIPYSRCVFLKTTPTYCKPLSSSTLHTFPHETYDLGIYEDIIEKKIMPFIKIINYIFIKIIELVEKYSKRNMKVELTNIYKSCSSKE